MKITTLKIKLSPAFQILVALVLSIIVGHFLQDNKDFALNYIQPFGLIFLNLLKFIVVPLVFLSIISGIVALDDINKIGKLGLRTLIFFSITTICAVALGLFLATMAKGLFPIIDIKYAQTTNEMQSIGVIDQFMGFFPKNIIEPFASTSMMQIIVIAIFFGVAISHVGERAKLCKDVILSFNHVVLKIMSYIISLAPIGVFCMLTPVVAENGAQVLGSFAVLVGTAYFAFLVHMFIVYLPCVKLIGKLNIFHFLTKMLPAMIFAYSSDSSVATLPYNMKSCGELGVNKSISSFVLPLGATINMDGTAIYIGITSVFIATCCGIDLTMQQYIAIALSSTIASIGTPGIPGGTLALMAMVFASSGIPIEGVAVVAGIDRIIDMGRTAMNITGDATCAVSMQRIMGDELKESDKVYSTN